jgi:chromosome partitioning protein
MLTALLNEKGGVGKTTSAASLAHAIARNGRRVLLVDLDPQANLTSWLADGRSPQGTIANALTDHRIIVECIAPSSADGVDLLHGSRDAADAADDLRASSVSPATALRRALRAVTDRYDDVIIDCPPGVGVLSVNAIVAAARVLVPIDSQSMALSGVSQLKRSIDELREAEVISEPPAMSAFLTKYDGRLGLAREVRRYLEGADSPITLHAARIRVSTRLAECFGHGKTIYDYAPLEPVAGDYESLAAELRRYD